MDGSAPGIPRGGRGSHAGLLRELGPELFRSLERRDQQTKAMQYVHALLTTPGRKSVRNIARAVGGAAAAQSLHHFVSRSPWDWGPVRAASARQLVEGVSPRAWVVHQTVIPKAGRNTVGVQRAFDPGSGRTVNGQRTLDLWAASATASAPVDWHLRLPDSWLGDAGSRRAAEIPDHVEPVDVAGAVLAMRARLVEEWRLPALPLVLDSRELDSASLLPLLAARGIGFVARISRDLPLRLDGVARTGPPRRARDLLAEQARRRQVIAGAPAGAGGKPVMAVTLPVRAAVPAGPGGGPAGTVTRAGGGPGRVAAGVPGAGTPLMLLGLGELGGPWPGEAWLTNLPDARPTTLHAYTRLIDQVERDFAAASRTVGLCDFTGRTYGGWHRHITLASTASAIIRLSR
ncbi:IS701 family transposase [Myceligenerans crystallogenes]